MARRGARRRLGAEPAPPLEGDTRADVAIVGGGFTGLWTALALKEREPALDVVVLEAEVCGRGPERARTAASSTATGATCRGCASASATRARSRSRARPTGIIPACARSARPARTSGCARAGLLRVSAAPAQDRSIGDEVEAARELGVPEEAVPLSREELARAVRSPVFRARRLLPRRRDRPSGAARARAAAARRSRRGAPARADAGHADRRRAARTTRDRCRPRRGGRRRHERRGGGLEAAARRLLTVFGSYVVLTEPVPGAARARSAGRAARRSPTAGCSSTTSARRTTAAC